MTVALFILKELHYHPLNKASKDTNDLRFHVTAYIYLLFLSIDLNDYSQFSKCNRAIDVNYVSNPWQLSQPESCKFHHATSRHRDIRSTVRVLNLLTLLLKCNCYVMHTSFLIRMTNQRKSLYLLM